MKTFYDLKKSVSTKSNHQITKLAAKKTERQNKTKQKP